MPGVCVSGTNVYVFYVVTTTTTNTVITAPIVAANGPLSYIGAGITTVSPPSTISGSGVGVPNNGVAGQGAGVNCVVAPIASGVATKRVTCPGTPGSSTAKGVIKLLCSPSRGRRTAHIARTYVSAAARARSTKRNARARRRPAARNVYLCKRI